MLEIWKPIVGYEGLYSVSNLGRVKSFPRNTTKGGILKPGLFTGGRPGVNLFKNGKKKSVRIATLVAEAFLGPKNGQQVRHKNDVTTDDKVSNLVYGSHQDNMDDKVRNGKSHKGETHHKAKLTEEQVIGIKIRLAAGENHHELAKEFNVSGETMQSIKHGRNWGWLALPKMLATAG